MKHELHPKNRMVRDRAAVGPSTERSPDDGYDQRRLISRLQDHAVFTHDTQRWQLIETHISWVILCGDYAYKIKKALNLGFLDFTTLEKRRYYCEEELRLNSRLAPDLYLAVVPITGAADQPRFEGIGRAREYAVKMRRFSQHALLSDIAERGQLSPNHVDQLAAQVASFHLSIPSASVAERYGCPEHVQAPVLQNYVQILEHVHDPKHIEWVNHLKAWTDQQYQHCYSVFLKRKQRGLIRECHGDMHLGNMSLVKGAPMIFDGVEFNPDLYWIDVMSDVAFLLMDLQGHHKHKLAFRFLNRYLELTGDYSGLQVLRYYMAYRAAVRSKIACIRLAQNPDGHSLCRLQEEFEHFLKLAMGYSQPQHRVLILTHGLSGSGKSTLSAPLAEKFGAILLRSDRERQRLFGPGKKNGNAAAISAGVYSSDATARTYARLLRLAKSALAAGFPVIVDATFLARSQREPFRALARRLSVPLRILTFDTDAELLKQRIKVRERTGQDISEADLSVLQHQLELGADLNIDEQNDEVFIDTSLRRSSDEIMGLLWRSLTHESDPRLYLHSYE